MPTTRREEPTPPPQRASAGDLRPGCRPGRRLGARGVLPSCPGGEQEGRRPGQVAVGEEAVRLILPRQQRKVQPAAEVRNPDLRGLCCRSNQKNPDCRGSAGAANSTGALRGPTSRRRRPARGRGRRWSRRPGTSRAGRRFSAPVPCLNCRHLKRTGRQRCNGGRSCDAGCHAVSSPPGPHDRQCPVDPRTRSGMDPERVGLVHVLRGPPHTNIPRPSIRDDGSTSGLGCRALPICNCKCEGCPPRPSPHRPVHVVIGRGKPRIIRRPGPVPAVSARWPSIGLFTCQFQRAKREGAPEGESGRPSRGTRQTGRRQPTDSGGAETDARTSGGWTVGRRVGDKPGSGTLRRR